MNRRTFFCTPLALAALPVAAAATKTEAETVPLASVIAWSAYKGGLTVFTEAGIYRSNDAPRHWERIG